VAKLVLKPIKYINGMSPYEWDRLQNIERNNNLFTALGMKGAINGLFGKEKNAKKGAENKPPKRKSMRKLSKSKAATVEKQVTRAGVKATLDKYVLL
jgi:hypothetical protein